ncbi:MAG: hypothetical protein QNJ84_02665 [Alphaproteobacteria bacterium]|nr:hypothetical protein [Alphaproteobacteria bacterium]
MYHTAFAALGALALTVSSASAETTAQNMIGAWQSELAEQQAPDGSASAYIRFRMTLDGNVQTLSTEAFADPEGQQPLFTYASVGPYTILGNHEPVSGALAVDFVNDVSELTIFVDAPDLWRAINMQDCPLEIGQAVEITDCVSGPPFLVTDCVDMDFVLVDMDGDRLRLGDQTVNRCETRPTAPSELPFFRVED